MLFESLAPVDEVSVIRACICAYLDVSSDLRLIVPPQFEKTFSLIGLDLCSKHPLFAVFLVPVFLDDPMFPFLLVSLPPPFHHLCVQVIVTYLKGFLCTHNPVIITPSPDDRIQFFNECLLRGSLEFLHPLVVLLYVCLVCLLVRTLLSCCTRK